jgi:hypothetical protein
MAAWPPPGTKIARQSLPPRRRRGTARRAQRRYLRNSPAWPLGRHQKCKCRACPREGGGAAAILRIVRGRPVRARLLPMALDSRLRGNDGRKPIGPVLFTKQPFILMFLPAWRYHYGNDRLNQEHHDGCHGQHGPKDFVPVPQTPAVKAHKRKERHGDVKKNQQTAHREHRAQPIL